MRATRTGGRALTLRIAAAALGFGGCAQAPAARLEVAADECYALEYDEEDQADTTLFPRGLLLAPGSEGGAVASGSAAADQSAFWFLFGSGARWRRLPSDSVAMSFSNGISSIDLVVAHDGARLRGTGSFRFQADRDPYPVLEVRGDRTECSGLR